MADDDQQWHELSMITKQNRGEPNQTKPKKDQWMDIFRNDMFETQK